MFRASHFDAAALEAIREVIRRELASVQGGDAPRRSRPLVNDDLALATGAVGAGSSTGAASATVTLLRPCSTGYADDTSDTVHNASTAAIASGRIYPVIRERTVGAWFAAHAAAGGASTQTMAWGVAQANWTNGADPYVSIKRCQSRTVSASTGAAFNCYLPRLGADRDPNVVSGAIIPYIIDENSAAACCGDYLDDKIRTLKFFVGPSSDIPTGWAHANGVANSTAAGGSGIAWSSGGGTPEHYMLRAAHTDADIGASTGSDQIQIADHDASAIGSALEDHDASAIANHAADVTGSTGDHAHTIGSATVTMADHAAANTSTNQSTVNDPGHNHGDGNALPVTSTGPGNAWDASQPSQTEQTGITLDGHDHTVGPLSHSSTAHSHSCGSTGNHAHTTPEHTHSGTLSHTGSTASSDALTHPIVSNIPLVKHAYFIERLDNSV